MPDKDNGTDSGTAVNTNSTDTSTPASTPTEPTNTNRHAVTKEGDYIDRALNAARQELGEIEVPEKIANEEFDLDKVGELEVDEGVKAASYQDLIKSEDVSPEVKALIKHFQADYTRKTQQLASTRKQYEEQLTALTNSDFSKKIEEVANEDLGELDPYDSKSFEKRIEQEVAKRMQELMNPLREQVAVQERKANLAKFKSEHPDLEDIKLDVAKELKANESLTLEQAYWVVKGRKLSSAQAEKEAELANYKKAAREAGLKVGGTRRGKGHGVPDHIISQGAIAIAEFLERNQYVN